MATRKYNTALLRADALITEILQLLSATTMDADMQLALETELLSLRIQVEIIRKESEKNEREFTRDYC